MRNRSRSKIGGIGISRGEGKYGTGRIRRKRRVRERIAGRR